MDGNLLQLPGKLHRIGTDDHSIDPEEHIAGSISDPLIAVEESPRL